MIRFIAFESLTLAANFSLEVTSRHITSPSAQVTLAQRPCWRQSQRPSRPSGTLLQMQCMVRCMPSAILPFFQDICICNDSIFGKGGGQWKCADRDSLPVRPCIHIACSKPALCPTQPYPIRHWVFVTHNRLGRPELPQQVSLPYAVL